MTTTGASAEASSKEENKPLKQNKKRRWLRRLGWCVVVLGMIAFLVNGIVARKVVHHYLNQSLEALGMTGSAEIGGSILGGFQVNDLNYSGDEGIQSLRIAHVALEYKIIELLDYKVELLEVSKLHATIDIAKFPPSAETDEPSSWKATLSEIRPLLMHPKIDLIDLEITLLDDAEKLLHWKLGSIQHGSAKDKINFKQWAITDSTGRSTPEQSATLIWQEGQVEFDQLNVLPELALSEIYFNWKSELNGKATLNYHDAEIDVDIAEKATLKLQNGEIRTAEIFKTLSSFGIDTSEMDIEAALNKLELSIHTDHLKMVFPLWEITGSLGLRSARWETYTLENTSLSFSQNPWDTHAGNGYKLGLIGSVINTPLKLDIKGGWERTTGKWWESTKAAVSFKTATNDEILALIPELDSLPSDIQINSCNIEGKVSAEIKDTELRYADGMIELSGMSVKESPLPTLALSASYVTDDDELKFKIKPKDSSSFILEAGIDASFQKYKGSFLATTNLDNSPWINALAETFDSPVKLNDELDIQWNGSGNLKSNTHKGKLTTNELTLTQKDQSPVTINLNGNYDWPKSLELEAISIAQEELFAEASLLWDGNEISIQNSYIKRDGELIANIKGKLPFTADIDTSTKFFAQVAPWEIIIDTEELSLKRLAELVPAPKDLKLEGTFQTKLNIAGSPRIPELNGGIDIKAVNDIFELGLDKVSLTAKLSTQDKLLKINGELLENVKQRKLIALDLEFPFTPHQWLEDDKLLETIQKSSKLKGTAEIKQLPLGKFRKFIPELEKMEGILDAKAEFNGTIAEPKYKIDFYANLPIVNIKNAGVDAITDIHIKGMLDQAMVLNTEIGAKINGGKFTTKVQIDINDPNAPIFDVKLMTDHALVYRDDILAMRTNANLSLKGTLEDATITGDIGILESLLYKDVDLIPIGAPSSAVENVSLPSLNTKANETLPIPAPFGQWKLDLTLKTLDPILIRGNVGSGQIQGSIKVRGTLAEPRLDGTLFAKKVKAKLPFSLLSVDHGLIKFNPNNGLIPTLEIRGKSQVGEYNVILYAYGSAAAPKIALSSYPALPENEIMTLLATGATNSGLANRDVATFKTLQLILMELKQRNDRPGGNRLFGKVLSGIDDLDLKVGEKNQLTGEEYASASIKLHQRWYLTAQIDNREPPQTRGLIIFALRFR
ncbi:MAG: hypothetical protein ACI9E1_000435 [Cryomorphaceae bacterium]|jgi:hypothetical protein